jgi:hypothetical protein
MLPESNIITKDQRRTAREALRRDMLANVGAVAALAVDDYLTMDVRITGVRERYGNLDYTIVPVAGSGERSVTPARLVIAR